MTGIQPIARNELVSVGATSVSVCLPLPRLDLVIRNTSAAGQVITLNIGSALAVANVGIVLNPGDVWQDTTNQLHPCWDGAVTAISSAAGGQLSVVER